MLLCFLDNFTWCVENVFVIFLSISDPAWSRDAEHVDVFLSLPYRTMSNRHLSNTRPPKAFFDEKTLKKWAETEKNMEKSDEDVSFCIYFFDQRSLAGCWGDAHKSVPTRGGPEAPKLNLQRYDEKSYVSNVVGPGFCVYGL